MVNIIISGTMRSGTTLMASILNAHPNIDLMSDTLTWFYKYGFYQYGPMESEFDLKNMIYDMKPHMLHHNNKYSIVELEKSVKTKGISYENIYKSLIELELNKNTLANYGIKATHLAYKYEYMIEKTPNIKIIHMVRDITDVYYSHKNFINKGKRGFLKKVRTEIKYKICRKLLNKKFLLEERIFNPYHFKEPMNMIDYWHSSNKTALDLKNKYPNNILIVKYETCITDIDSTMKEVMSFLDVPFIDNFYQYDKLQDRNNNKWKDNSSFKVKNKNGYDKSKIGRGGEKLLEEELMYINKVCCNTIKKLGYQNFYNESKCRNEK